jgi:predicted metal-dependent hydrolase
MKYKLIRAHKRTLSLQVNRQGELIVRAPYLMPVFFIDRFINQKSSWVQKRLADLKRPQAPKVEHFTEAKLKFYISKQLEVYGSLMGLKHSGLRFTKVNSYWGTCAPTGVLSFNLALRYAPGEAVTYVVVHELAHLRYRGHGKRFWDLVRKTYPPTNEMRVLLRQIGSGNLTEEN